MKTWTKVALGALTGIVASQIVRARKVNISYAAQLVEDSLTLASSILPFRWRLLDTTNRISL
ncbi:hypothetical protein APT62_03455 [Aerococcus urinaeequi]|uniref:hypothetical protein n=1 Tax=Aerococcus urinaeequi TaxID=51665 RepID=UPI000744977F|nr:hypothetical protein [Aerococcus urinaeequi]ALZ87568.1 hypothetical protein APT62_03455 [Aerococcus urinaeequi]